MPKTQLKKIVIQANERVSESASPLTICDSTFILNQLKDSLCGNGIGYFVYSFPEGINPIGHFNTNWSLYTYADDVDIAISVLKKEKEFQNIEIGVIGCSELGCSAAVVASRNPKVSFMISITSLIVNGCDNFLYNWLSDDNKGSKGNFYFFEMMLKSILTDYTPWNDGKSFMYKGKRYLNTNQKFDDCFKETIDSVGRYIFTLNKYDKTIPTKASKLIKNLWQNNNHLDTHQKVAKVRHKQVSAFTINVRFPDQKVAQVRHKLGFDELIDSIICKRMFTLPSQKAMTQWNRGIYSKIKIPTLIALGDQDKLIRYSNDKDAQNIIEKYHNLNITLKVFKDHGHMLSTQKMELKKISVQTKTGVLNLTAQCTSTPSSTISWIVDWIKNH